ncbi:hypothetical protein HMPREF9016_00157 [Neisseria sp. oral taxon 014 str. F0314]|nr:hypothetical protein HMPREF9016_00157 [Neisseria sp. oral taxon 014 str. F0314]
MGGYFMSVGMLIYMSFCGLLGLAIALFGTSCIEFWVIKMLIRDSWLGILLLVIGTSVMLVSGMYLLGVMS